MGVKLFCKKALVFEVQISPKKKVLKENCNYMFECHWHTIYAWFFVGKSFALKKKKNPIATPKKEKLDGANDSKKFLEKNGLKVVTLWGKRFWTCHI